MPGLFASPSRHLDFGGAVLGLVGTFYFLGQSQGGRQGKAGNTEGGGKLPQASKGKSRDKIARHLGISGRKRFGVWNEKRPPSATALTNRGIAARTGMKGAA